MSFMDKFSIKGKKYIVTGGAQGIGKAVSAAMADCGAQVGIFDMNIDLARKTAAELQEKYGTKVEERMRGLIGLCDLKREELCGRTYLRRTDKCLEFDFYRVEPGEPIRKSEEDFTPYEIVALIRGLLENKVSLYADELVSAVCEELKIARPSDKFVDFIHECVQLGVSRSLFIRSISDRISLA